MDGLMLLRQAKEAGLAVAAENGKLVIRGPKRAEPGARLLIENKVEVLVALAPPKHVTEPADAWGEEAEAERAAVVEHDGKIPRAWAEGFARLDPDRPPAGVPLLRWQAVIDAIGTFLDRWAAEAAVMGWEPCDIFGADATRPGVTWLNAGPLWSGDGARVVEVHSDRIIFETRGDARQTAYRRPAFRPRALPWDLVR